MLRVIGFDADDTLWHNESRYRQAGGRFRQLVAGYQGSEQVEHKLGEIEIRNLRWYGYGIKSYTLSMIEAAIELSAGQVTGEEIQRILELGREMLSAQVLLFEHAEKTLAALASGHDLMLITKGDLLEQGNKLERSGLAGYFSQVEIVQEKTAAGYQRLLGQHGIQPDQFMMVGNSLRSDILPVLQIGGRAVYIPYELTWAYESAVEYERQQPGYYELEHLGQLPGLIAELTKP
jgi:putative hydrolase of the HAD superfamily